MINLLPPDYGSKIRSAHLNSLLRRWVIFTFLAAAGLVVIMAGTWLVIDQQSRSLNRNISSGSQQLQLQDLAGTQAKAKAISSNIKVINQVLSREIRFSDLIKQIGSVMPPGTVLSGLTLGNVSGALDLSASAKDSTSAAQISVNLSDPKNKIFDKVDIVNVNCAANSTNAYPCTVSLKALFSTSTKNRFLNIPGSSK